jgi:hypothetical protein
MDTRKSIFASLGSATFVAGIAALAASIGSVVDAPPHRDLVVEYVVLGLSVAMVVIGIYVIVAALSRRLPLPGGARAREQSRQHELARFILGQAVIEGVKLTVGTPNPAAVLAWAQDVRRFLVVTWGDEEAVLLRARIRYLDGSKSLPADAVELFLRRLEDFVGRARQVPLRPDAKPIDQGEWGLLLGEGGYVREERLPAGACRPRRSA